MSLFPLPSLLSIGLIEQLYLLMIPRALLCLASAVLPMSLHSVRYSDIYGLCFCGATAGDEQGVRGSLTQVTGDKAVLPSGVTKWWRAGMGGGLTDVRYDRDAVHCLFIVTNFQNFKMDLDISVPNPSSNSHLHSNLHPHSYTAGVHISTLASGCCFVCTGLMANWLRTINFHLRGREISCFVLDHSVLDVIQKYLTML